MKKKIKVILLVVFTLAAIGIIAVTAMQPLAVEIVVITPSNAELSFTERGYVRDDRCVNVYSLVSGTILSVDAREGQSISEGDLIAIVDPVDLLHEIEQLRASNLALYAQIDNLEIEESSAKLSQLAAKNVLQSELNAINTQEQIARTTELNGRQVRDENIRLQNILIEQSIFDVQNATNNLERAQMLFDDGVITRMELEASEQALEAHRTALLVNEQRIEVILSESGIVDQSEHFTTLRSSIQTQINGIDATLNQLSSEPMARHFHALIESNNLAIANLERMVENSAITSPVSGIIERLHVDYTNILNPSMPVAEIRTQGDNLIEVLVSTANITDISVGDSVELIFNRQSGDAVYSGTVHSIGTGAEAMVSILGVEERRVEVLIEPDVFSDSFRSGFDVDVRFITFSAEDRIVVPRTAVFEKDGRYFLYAMENGTAVARPVEVSTQLRTKFIIESGVNVGDVVIKNARQEGMVDGVRAVYA